MHRRYDFLKLTLAFAVLWMGAVTLAQAQRTKTVERTVALDADGQVVIDTFKGSVRVTTWDRAEVEIEVRIEADEDTELVEGTDIKIRSTDRRLVLETDYEEAERMRRRRNWDNVSMPFAHYTLKIPRTAHLRIDDYKSNLYITDLSADLDVETYKGQVEIKGLAGALRLETYKGEVEVHFARLADDSSFETYKGDIAIHLPDEAGFDLDADLGKRGDLDTDFRLNSLRRGDHSYRGDVNGGGPRIRLDTYKGTFRLDTR